MVYKVLLTDRALKDLSQTVAYLLKEWTIKEADSFLNELERVKKLLITDPFIFAEFDKSKTIHSVILTKHNRLYYQINTSKKTVYILTIFNVFQDPEKVSL